MSNLTRFVCRVLFVVAFLIAGLAVWEKLANLAGYTLLRSAYAPTRLLEIAALDPLFVLALLLREISHQLAGKA